MITDSRGDPLTRREFLRRIGRLEQVAGIDLFVFDDGPSRGVRAFRFRTGSSLSFDVLPDRSMDLRFAEQGGTSHRITPFPPSRPPRQTVRSLADF